MADDIQIQIKDLNPSVAPARTDQLAAQQENGSVDRLSVAQLLGLITSEDLAQVFATAKTWSPTQTFKEIQITSAVPRIQFTDIDTGADCAVTADSASGTLTIRADFNAEQASSAVILQIDGVTNSFVFDTDKFVLSQGQAIQGLRRTEVCRYDGNHQGRAAGHLWRCGRADAQAEDG